MTTLICKECRNIIIENIERKDVIYEEYIQCPHCGRVIKNPLKK